MRSTQMKVQKYKKQNKKKSKEEVVKKKNMWYYKVDCQTNWKCLVWNDKKIIKVNRNVKVGTK